MFLTRWILAILSITILISFVFPWISVNDHEILSGFGVVMELQEGASFYWFLYTIPIAAVFATFIAFKWVRIGSFFAAIVGFIAILIAGVEVARKLYEVTFGGLWLAVISSFLLMITGLLGMRTPKEKKKKKNQSKNEKITEEKKEPSEITIDITNDLNKL